MSEDIKGASLRDRAVVNGAGHAVSALRASVPSAVRRFIRWSGPWGMAVLGMTLLLLGVVVTHGPHVAVGVLGGLMIFSSLEMYAERAKAVETERWAKLIAGMIQEERKVAINVNHTWESMRPYLEESIARMVAQAMSAGTAETQSGSGLQPASAVAEGNAPETPTEEQQP